MPSDTNELARIAALCEQVSWVRGMALIAQDTEVRPASLSYVKPSEYKRQVDGLLESLATLLPWAAQRIAELEREVERLQQLLRAPDASGIMRVRQREDAAHTAGFASGIEAAAKVCEDFSAPERWPDGDLFLATETQAAEEAAYMLAVSIRALTVPGETR